MEPLVGNVQGARSTDDHPTEAGHALFGRITKTFAAFQFQSMRNWWIRRSLFEQFAMTSSVVLTLSISAVGGWIGARIADGVLHGTSGAAALYMTNFVEPHVQSMDGGGLISQEDIRRLDLVGELLKSRRHVASIKIWHPDGTIVYSTDKSLVGKQFTTADILPSLKGKIRAGMADLNDGDNEFERSLSMPLYEIFIPLYKSESDRIIAVAEIYEDASELLHDQASAVIGAWTVVGSAGIATLFILFAIVHRGSATIQRQRAAIKLRYREAMLLHRKNAILTSQREAALRTSGRIDDLIHMRLGAELHDGPVQLISFVLLRLEQIEHGPNDGPLLQQLRTSLQTVLAELRAIAAGLLFPELGETMSASEVLRKIIRAHERRSSCVVDYKETGLPDRLPCEVLRCMVRVTQEALNNAYKHPGSSQQAVSVGAIDGVLRLSVSDNGCGIDHNKSAGTEPGLGMRGMAARIAAVRGSFSVISEKGRGTEIVCEIFLDCGA
jgi:signal transduction histidine kinase